MDVDEHSRGKRSTSKISQLTSLPTLDTWELSINSMSPAASSRNGINAYCMNAIDDHLAPLLIVGTQQRPQPIRVGLDEGAVGGVAQVVFNRVEGRGRGEPATDLQDPRPGGSCGSGRTGPPRRPRRTNRYRRDIARVAWLSRGRGNPPRTGLIPCRGVRAAPRR